MSNRLLVLINSFSYAKGANLAESNHGGGFIFDCRCLPNPGREEEFAGLTGLDEQVRNYLGASADVLNFFESVENVVSQAICNYLERGFSELMISFGCTGGQHRSVYLAEHLGESLARRNGLLIKIDHQMLGVSREIACEQ